VPFRSYSPEIRRVIYSTNAIESMHARFRRAVRVAPDPFVAPYCGFLLERTPKAQPAEPNAWRKDEYPD
jgi:transposase-like protein